ncbi:hypothetical protein GF322_03050 [Candidatus Dependentiae bacterium]|nr:hypothetical protein [Candidatus Dependentiae bacterium]
MKKILYVINFMYFFLITSSVSAMGLIMPKTDINVTGLDQFKFYLRFVFIIELLKIVLIALILFFVIKISIKLHKK